MASIVPSSRIITIGLHLTRLILRNNAFHLPPSYTNTHTQHNPTTPTPQSQHHQWELPRPIHLPVSVRDASPSSSNRNRKTYHDAYSSFTGPETTVYIEDTDAYGVLYNSNYLRAYERALFAISIDRRTRTNDPNDETPTGLLSNPNEWVLIGATNHKFKASPPLGGSFVITGQLIDRNNNNTTETWNMLMTNSDNTIIYNTASVTIASSNSTTITEPPIPRLEPPLPPESITTTTDVVGVQPDEFQTSPRPHIPLRTILNYFERSRSNFLGGPAVLRKMQTEGKIVWVVVKIDDCALVGNGGGGGDGGGGNDVGTESILVPSTCRPGQNVLVETSFRSKRRHMLVECYQTLFIGTETEPNQHRMAQAVLTIMALDAETRRPCSNIPEWIVDILEGRGE